jgi:hypothetical protein
MCRGDFCSQKIDSRHATWGDALREAGFEPNRLQPAYSEDVLIEKFIGFMRELGRFPVATEVKMRARNDDGFPWHNTFARFGSKGQFAKRIMEYCNSRTGYDDIIALCRPIVPAEIKEARKDEAEEVIGFVYLMKSGSHYKVRRSNAVGRREYELTIQLPERLVTVHAIRTDDPAGIEGYWHRRFASERKNGEWFDLTTADVKAFKRRKFMWLSWIASERACTDVSRAAARHSCWEARLAPYASRTLDDSIMAGFDLWRARMLYELASGARYTVRHGWRLEYRARPPKIVRRGHKHLRGGARWFAALAESAWLVGMPSW